MNPLGAANKYSIAPKGSFVVVGAHAVYMRAPEPVASLTPFTFDGDLAANPEKIRKARLIAERLATIGLSFRGRSDGFYWRADAPEDQREATKIETDFTQRDSHATTSQRGLELCFIDNSPLSIGPIEPDEDHPPLDLSSRNRGTEPNAILRHPFREFAIAQSIGGQIEDVGYDLAIRRDEVTAVNI